MIFGAGIMVFGPIISVWITELGFGVVQTQTRRSVGPFPEALCLIIWIAMAPNRIILGLDGIMASRMLFRWLLDLFDGIVCPFWIRNLRFVPRI